MKLTNAEGVEFKLSKKQLQAIEFNKALLAMYTNQVGSKSLIALAKPFVGVWHMRHNGWCNSPICVYFLSYTNVFFRMSYIIDFVKQVICPVLCKGL